MLRKTLKLTAIGTVGAMTATAVLEPQKLSPIKKILNVGVAGGKIFYVYKYTDEPVEQKNAKAANHLRQALVKNGGLYLKLGQLIATLDVIVPDEFRKELMGLTRDCPVTPFAKVAELIEQETGFTVEELFEEFEEAPISSASIGQVHRARMHSGAEVAVKVQHPELARSVDYDMRLMKFFCGLANRAFEDFKYNWLIEEFDKNMRVELDFVNEARNMCRLGQFIREEKLAAKMAVPRYYEPLTSRLFIMEFVHGYHIDEVVRMQQNNIALREIGRLFSQLIIKMIHKKGFVHGDPHAGNLKVRIKPSGDPELVILDHGLYQSLDEDLRTKYNRFWLGLILNDESIYDPAARSLGAQTPKMLVSMLTSKTQDELNDPKRRGFDFNPTSDKTSIMLHAQKHHDKIVDTLNQLRREILLLLKVNEFARSIENTLGGRPFGVYEEIARECVQNLHLSWWRRFLYYWRMFWIR